MAWVTPTNVATGDVLTAATWNQAVVANAVEVAPFFGAWTSYTPTLSQGASTNITKTVTAARYLKVGRMVAIYVRLAITGAGTGANEIRVSLPSGADAAAEIVNGMPIGSGWYLRSGTGFYWAQAFVTTSTTVALYNIASATGNSIGALPNFATQNNDAITFSGVYEAAA